MPISWITFALTVAFLYLVLSVPGFTSLRALGLPRPLALACGPVAALSCAAILACIYPHFDIRATTMTLMPPLYAIALSLCLGALILKKTGKTLPKTSFAKNHGANKPEPNLSFTLLSAASYVIVAIVVAACALLEPLGTPDAIVFSHDNVRHFGQIECFTESGVWSSLSTTLYPDGYGAEFDPFGTTGFYPSTWHLVSAMAVDSLGTPVSFAANATNIVFSALIYPIGMFALISYLFPRRKDTILIGSVCTSAFTAFPWTVFGVWEVYPFAASLCLVPAVAASFIALVENRLNRMGTAPLVVTIIFGAIALALTQPSAIFTTAVFLAPFCLASIYRALERIAKDGKTPCRASYLGVLGFMLLIVALWSLACLLPPIKQAMSWSWNPVADPASAMIDAAFLSFAEPMPQIALALAVFAGCAYCMIARRRRWLIAAFCIACSMFVVAASLPNVPFKQILTGFWYTDYYRIAAFTAMFATPLASAGLAYVAHRVSQAITAWKRKAIRWGRIFKTGAKRNAQNPNPLTGKTPAIACIIVVMLFSVINFRTPITDHEGLYLDSPFARIRGMVTAHSTASPSNCYDSEKRAFVDKATEIVGSDALVINLPYDGSLYAFSTSDMNLYQRYMTGYESDGEAEASAQIRHSLYNVASDERTQQAIRSTGAEYVLILDRDEDDMARWFWKYDESEWGGIELVKDDTPGFEMILSEGEMRLYRIAPFDTPQD